jgi:hypothetical protein
MINWLVVSTPLNNISKLGLFFPIYGKIENVPNHKPVMSSLPQLPTCSNTKNQQLEPFYQEMPHLSYYVLQYMCLSPFLGVSQESQTNRQKFCALAEMKGDILSQQDLTVGDSSG